MTGQRSALLDAGDRLALVISGACVIHCLALPLVFAALPMLSHFTNIPESLHLWLVVVAVPISGYALLAGRGDFPNHRPLFIGGAGMVLLAIGAFAAGEAALETSITVAGGLLVAAAHGLHWRRRHSVNAN